MSQKNIKTKLNLDAFAIKCDVTNEKQVRNSLKKIKKKFEKKEIFGLINNAAFNQKQKRYDGKIKYFATSGGFSDVRPEGVQLLLETVEEKTTIDKKRAETALQKADKRVKDKTMDVNRASRDHAKAKNRLNNLNNKK